MTWYGPLVMNTQKQTQEAFEELEAGTFLKSNKISGAERSSRNSDVRADLPRRRNPQVIRRRCDRRVVQESATASR
jgi:hypothetical protein